MLTEMFSNNEEEQIDILLQAVPKALLVQYTVTLSLTSEWWKKWVLIAWWGARCWAAPLLSPGSG